MQWPFVMLARSLHFIPVTIKHSHLTQKWFPPTVALRPTAWKKVLVKLCTCFDLLCMGSVDLMSSEASQLLDNMRFKKCTYLEPLPPPYFPVIFVHIWLLGWQLPAHYLWLHARFTFALFFFSQNSNAEVLMQTVQRSVRHFLPQVLYGLSRHTETILMFDRFQSDQSPLCFQV